MFETVTMYRLICDFPDCGACAQEGGEYSAWGEPSSAEMDAEYSDWVRGAEDDSTESKWFCGGHPSVWASEFESDEPGWDLGALPEEAPFLILDDLIGEGAHLVAVHADAPALLDRLAAPTTEATS